MVLARFSLTLTLISLVILAGGAFAKGAAADASTTSAHHRHVNSQHGEHPKTTSKTASAASPRRGRHAQLAAEPEKPRYVVVKDRHGRTHRVAREAATAVAVHGPAIEKRRELIVVRDRHGRAHKVYREVTLAAEAQSEHTHKETKRVTVMVRDKRGHLHKVFKNEVVQVAAEKRLTRKSESIKVTAGGRKNEDSKEESIAVTHPAETDTEPKGTDMPERMNPSFGKAYALYDEGANARISGNYPLAISCLGRALAMVPANSHGGPSVLQLNMEYELAQSAEASGDMALAARYYARALSDRPNFTEASVRLATVLARSGKYAEALRTARAATQRSPNDPRTHAILTVLLEKTGALEEAKSEKSKTRSLMANVRAIDTAPLVPPNTVINDAPPSVPTGETNNNAGGENTPGEGQNMGLPARGANDSTPKNGAAPQPGTGEELN